MVSMTAPCRRWGRTVPTRGPDGFRSPEDDGVKSRLDCEPCDGGDDEQPEQKLHVEGWRDLIRLFVAVASMVLLAEAVD